MDPLKPDHMVLHVREQLQRAIDILHPGKDFDSFRLAEAIEAMIVVFVRGMTK